MTLQTDNTFSDNSPNNSPSNSPSNTNDHERIFSYLPTGIKKGIKSGLTFGILAFFLAFPILGVRLELISGKLLITQSLMSAVYAGLAVFLYQLILQPTKLIIKQQWRRSAFCQSIVDNYVNPTKQKIERIKPVTNRFLKPSIVPILIILAVIFPFVASRGDIDIVTLAIIYVLLGLGLNVVVGFAGLLDLGYVGFYAIGAYTYALLNHYYGLGFWYALPIAGLATAVMGILLGFPVLRLRGDYLAIVTLGFGEIIRILLNNLDSYTGGPNGISSIDKPTLFGLEFSRNASEGSRTFHDYFNISFSSEHRVMFLFFIGLTFVLITLFIINRLIKMPIGRAWEALRDDEIACRSLGLNPTIIKLSAFAIGATFAGFAGAFFAAKQGFINPESFTFIESAIILAIVVLGGMGSQAGVILAALILTLLPDIARSFESYRMLIFGLVMVFMMIWRPQGLIPAKRSKIKVK